MTRFNVLFVLITIFLIGCGDSEKEETVENVKESYELEGTPHSEDDIVIAKWNSGKIYLSQLEKVVQPQRKQLEETGLDEESINARMKEYRGEVLRNLINNYLLLLEAQSQGIGLTNAEKEKIMLEVKSKFESSNDYQQQLNLHGQNEQSMEKIMSQIKLGQKCIKQKNEEIQKSMTEETLRDFYHDNIELFTPPGRSDINRVVILPNEDRTAEEAKALAQELRNDVAKKMEGLSTFKEKRKIIQECARANSDTPDADYNWGFATIYLNKKVDYSEEFVEALQTVPEGELSDVVKMYDGYGFFFPNKHFKSTVNDFDHPVVQSLLPNLYATVKIEEWRRSLKKKFQFELQEENLKGLVPLPLSKDEIYSVTEALKIR